MLEDRPTFPLRDQVRPAHTVARTVVQHTAEYTTATEDY